MGVYVGIVRILAAFEMDVEEDYLKELVDFPRPGNDQGRQQPAQHSVALPSGSA